MASLAIVDDADDFARGVRALSKKLRKGFSLQMGLIAERDDEVGQRGIPGGQTGGGDHGAHHAALGRDGGGALIAGNFEAVEFLNDGGGFALRIDDEDFFRASLPPLGEEMAEDGGVFPREAKLGLAHAKGIASSEDGDEGGGHPGRWSRSGDLAARAFIASVSTRTISKIVEAGHG